MDATDQSINKSDLSENNKTRGSLEPVIAHLVLKFTSKVEYLKKKLFRN
jgi:hypothetical protein